MTPAKSSMTRQEILIMFDRKRRRIIAPRIVPINMTDPESEITLKGIHSIAIGCTKGEYRVYYMLNTNDMFCLCGISPEAIKQIDPEILDEISGLYWHGEGEDMSNMLGRQGISFS